MIRLAVLLVGVDAMRRKWPVLAAIGVAWMALAVAIIFDAADGVTTVATHSFGYLLIVEGAVAFVMMVGAGGGTALYIARALVLIALGCMIADVPVRIDIANSILFGIAFMLDGVARIVTASTIRYPRWQLVALGGLVEIVLGGIAFASWPISYRKTVPFCIGVALLITGFNALRIGLLLRRLPSEGRLGALPLFAIRGWHEATSVPAEAPSTAPPKLTHKEPLVLHVWTPVGSATDPARRPLIDRYIAAVDGKGVISTGHASLELKPDVYVSHYPAIEIDHSPDDFATLLRASSENDVKGRFQPSYDYEVGDWVEADQHIKFRRYDAAKLRRFWEVYRQTDTYNLTNRNCSVSAAVALDAALEGVLASRFVWSRFLLLMINPDLWLAAMLRFRAESMTWTPGLVLDYARAVRRVTEPLDRGWFGRAQDTLRRWRETREFERLRREAAAAVARHRSTPRTPA